MSKNASILFHWSKKALIRTSAFAQRPDRRRDRLYAGRPRRQRLNATAASWRSCGSTFSEVNEYGYPRQDGQQPGHCAKPENFVSLTASKAVFLNLICI